LALSTKFSSTFLPCRTKFDAKSTPSALHLPNILVQASQGRTAIVLPEISVINKRNCSMTYINTKCLNVYLLLKIGLISKLPGAPPSTIEKKNKILRGIDRFCIISSEKYICSYDSYRFREMRLQKHIQRDVHSRRPQTLIPRHLIRS
jgi:hypothetical protein